VRFAGYVITGWVLTGAVFLGYWYSLVARTRRAERSLPAGDGAAAGRKHP
jgi:hypothetical protein